MADFGMNILMKLLTPVLILVLGRIGISVARRLLKKSKLDEALHKFIITVAEVVLYAVVFLILLEQFGIDTKGMITVLGVSGGAVALALKDSLSNVAGGFIILITKPFSKDDYVDIDGTRGVVEQIDMLLTTLKTYDNKTVTMPNGMVSTAVITNYTKADKRRVDLLFPLEQDADVGQAREIMEQVALENEKILKDEGFACGIARTTSVSTEVEFKVWTRTEDYWDVKYYLEEKIKDRLSREGIEMAKGIMLAQ